VAGGGFGSGWAGAGCGACWGACRPPCDDGGSGIALGPDGAGRGALLARAVVVVVALARAA
jgi:hypothetical protein